MHSEKGFLVKTRLLKLFVEIPKPLNSHEWHYLYKLASCKQCDQIGQFIGLWATF